MEEIYIFGLELKRWLLEFVNSFSKLYLGFGSEVCLMPFGIMLSKSCLRAMDF
jgi:hypothetical protein